MRRRNRTIACLVAAAMLTWVGTAVAGDDDDERPGVSGTTANSITSSSAVLGGMVDPNDSQTTYRFEYGTTVAYGTPTPVASAGGGESAKAVTATVSGLAPSTTYHFRLVATNGEGTTRGPDRTFTTLAEPVTEDPPTTPPGSEDPGTAPPPGEPGSRPTTSPQPTPELGSSVLAAPTRGHLLVRRPKSSRFVPLELGAELPMGTVVDATQGALAVTSALPSGSSQTGHFGGGRFVIRQGRRGYLDLHLRGRLDCRSSQLSVASAAAASKKKRRLWGRDHGGRFRTHGRNSHATVRGTRWLLADSCRGTLTRVSHGSVVVTDRLRKKRVLLEAGESYLARSRR